VFMIGLRWTQECACNKANWYSLVEPLEIFLQQVKCEIDYQSCSVLFKAYCERLKINI